MPENQFSDPVGRDDALSVEHQGDISIIRIQDPQLLQYLKGLEMLTKAIDSVRLQQSKAVVIHNAPSAYAPENLDAFWNQVDAETSNRADHHLVKRMRYRLAELFNLFWELNSVEIVTVRGPVDLNLFGLVLTADFSICSDDFELRNRMLDQRSSPSSVAVWFLTQYIGLARTKRLIMEEKSLSAQEALDLGLINRVTTEENLDAVALAEAQRLAREEQESRQ